MTDEITRVSESRLFSKFAHSWRLSEYWSDGKFTVQQLSNCWRSWTGALKQVLMNCYLKCFCETLEIHEAVSEREREVNAHLMFYRDKAIESSLISALIFKRLPSLCHRLFQFDIPQFVTTYECTFCTNWYLFAIEPLADRQSFMGSTEFNG